MSKIRREGGVYFFDFCEFIYYKTLNKPPTNTPSNRNPTFQKKYPLPPSNRTSTYDFLLAFQGGLIIFRVKSGWFIQEGYSRVLINRCIFIVAYTKTYIYIYIKKYYIYILLKVKKTLWGETRIFLSR